MSANVVFKEPKLSAKEWKALYYEAFDHAGQYYNDVRFLEEEVHYLSEYISWKGLEEEFALFREQAHEEQSPDEPFPRLVM